MIEPRKMRSEEILLLNCLLANTNYKRVDFTDQKVIDMNDGGMGSVKFIYERETARRMAKQLVEKEFRDSDGILISVAINIDQYGDLFELDIWKVDFTRVLKYPRC